MFPKSVRWTAFPHPNSGPKLMKKLFLAVLILLALCGCGKEEPIVYEYTEGYTAMTEPLGEKFLFPACYLETEFDGNIFRFAPDISEEDRRIFIESQNKIIGETEKLFDVEISGFTFYVLEDYSVRSDSENFSAYFGISESGTYKQVLGTVLSVFGDFTNYGFAYALSDSISENLGFLRDDIPEENLSVFISEPEMLNLNYACFSSVSSSDEEIAAAKALSLELFKNLEAVSEEAFVSALSEKAVSIGADDFVPTSVGFAYGGENCPMRVRTVCLDMMVDSDYKTDAFFEEGFYTEEWTSTVSSFITYMENLDARLLELCGLFGFEPDAPIPTYLVDEISYTANGKGLWGLFQPREPDIYSCGYDVIVHEYVHYLWDSCADYNGNEGIDSGKNPYLEAWHGESIAYYFGSEQLYKFFVLSFGEDFESVFEGATGSKLEKAGDISKYYDAVFHVNYKLDPKKTPKSHTSDRDGDTVSFGGYVARTYGEETFVNIMLHPSLCTEYTGKTFAQIEDEWEDYIMNGVVLGDGLMAELNARLN